MKAVTAPKPGRKVRLRSLADVDKRTSAARAAIALRASLISDLGGSDALSTMEAELVENAAILGAMLRDAAARYLAGEEVDLNEFQTLTNAQRRLLADLGLQRRQKDVTPSLKAYVKAKQGGHEHS